MEHKSVEDRQLIDRLREALNSETATWERFAAMQLLFKTYDASENTQDKGNHDQN